MKLGDTEFGNVFASSGTLNFDGSGWWYHRLLRLLGLNFTGATFVTKTILAMPYVGNMPLRADGKTPMELMPRSIYISVRSWIYGAMLNAVKFAGRGIKFALAQGWWQQRTDPFVISISTVEGHQFTEREQLEYIVRSLAECKDTFRSPFAIELDISCPSFERDTGSSMVAVVREWLDILAPLKVPVILKCAITMNWTVVADIATHPTCSAVHVSNTVRWGKLPNRIPWRTIFGTDRSPLEKRLGTGNVGGISGAPLAFPVREWIWYAMSEGFPKPIIAGGGILKKAAVEHLVQMGVAAISLGSVAILRPWRVASIIRYAEKRFAEKAAQRKRAV